MARCELVVMLTFGFGIVLSQARRSDETYTGYRDTVSSHARHAMMHSINAWCKDHIGFHGFDLYNTFRGYPSITAERDRRRADDHLKAAGSIGSANLNSWGIRTIDQMQTLDMDGLRFMMENKNPHSK
eukprot:c10319_g1_i2.p1 GENE.c10319_g1_i2~~c10319_g1_i2.p1  ORF type:complete len:128 (+),score=9.58 c10319_g1_i2:38-421(+)